MPEISRLSGVIITMYYNDHPPPHFHVRDAGQKAIITIKSPYVWAGELSSKTVKLVTEWAILHQTELLENWELAEKNQPLNKIPGLE